MIKQVEFTLENHGISKFLYYQAASKEEIDAGQMEYVRNSRIPGILPCRAIVEGENCYLRYDLISDTTLEMRNSNPATRQSLYNSFLNIAETLTDAKESGLEIENFVFSQRNIFIDNFSNRLVFIYLPVKVNIFEKVSLKDFLRELLHSARYDENDDAVFFVRLHNYLAGTEAVTPESVLENLHALAGDTETIYTKPTKASEPFFQKAANENPNWSLPNHIAVQSGEVLPASMLVSSEKFPELHTSPADEALNPPSVKEDAPVQHSQSVNEDAPAPHSTAATLDSDGQENTAMQPHFYSPGSEVHTVKTSVENGVLTSEYTSQKKDVKTGRKLEIEEEVNYKRITRAELGENNEFLKDGTALGGTSIHIQPAIANHHLEEMDSGTTVLGVLEDDEDEGTTTLGHSVRRPFLMAVAKNEKITIAKDYFKIGRDPLRADFATDNKVIGRVHASVISSNGEYFLEDNHSTNGSYVNGVKVVPKEKIKIKHEDRIKLANEEFIFRLY